MVVNLFKPRFFSYNKEMDDRFATLIDIPDAILPYLKTRDAKVLNKVNSIQDSIMKHTWSYDVYINSVIDTSELTRLRLVGHNPSVNGLSLTPDEKFLLACDRFNGHVLVYDATNGNYIRKLTVPNISRYDDVINIHDAVVVPQTGNVLVVDNDNCYVHVLSGIDDETLVGRIGNGVGKNPSQLLGPNGLDVLNDSSNGPLVVIADTGNDRLSLFNLENRTLVRNIVGTGPMRLFSKPYQVKVVPETITGKEAWLAVSEYMENRCGRIQVLTSEGESIYMLSDSPEIPLGFLYGITVSNEDLFVSDVSRQRVVSCRLKDGSGFREVLSRNQFNIPRGVAVTRNGEQLWVSDTNKNNRLCLFTIITKL
jgi:DNA-binding beta-propeller fold protein YncE